MWYKVFIVLLFTGAFAATVKAQERYSVPAGPLHEELKTALFPASAARSPLYIPLSVAPVNTIHAAPAYIPAAGYYQQHFGFFCKQEWQWEKQTRLPVKLRLGRYESEQGLNGLRDCRD